MLNQSVVNSKLTYDVSDFSSHVLIHLLWGVFPSPLESVVYWQSTFPLLFWEVEVRVIKYETDFKVQIIMILSLPDINI